MLSKNKKCLSKMTKNNNTYSKHLRIISLSMNGQTATAVLTAMAMTMTMTMAFAIGFAFARCQISNL